MKKSIYALLFFGLFCSITLTAQKSKKQHTRSLEAFEKVVITGHADVHLYPDSKNELRVSGNNLDWTLLKSEVKDGTLHIYYDKYKSNNNFKNEPKLTIQLAYQKMKELDLEGKIWVATEGEWKSRNMDIHGMGIIKGQMNVRAEYLTVSIEGMPRLEMSGKAENVRMTMEGMGGIDASRLVSRTAYTKVEGMGKVQIDAREELEGTFSGIGSINYSGNPERRKINKEGIVIVRGN
ncbi:MAG: DUF2807 domain-containing protein [Bacteroidota bacterium]